MGFFLLWRKQEVMVDFGFQGLEIVGGGEFGEVSEEEFVGLFAVHDF